jgi:zinc and cadmium transporter
MFSVIVASLVGGLFSLIGGMMLLRSKKSAAVLAEYATPFAAGALISAAILDLLHEALEINQSDGKEPIIVLYALSFGILLFFVLERFLHFFHHHYDHDEQDKKVSNSLIIVGDTVHNALDGVAIAASFLVSVELGIVTTLAVALHEIPQEIGDFGLMLKNGMSRKRVLLVNVASSLSTVASAVFVYQLGSERTIPQAFLLSVTAGLFLYIALSDIIPTVHETSSKKIFDIRPILVIVGFLVVTLLSNYAHGIISNKTSEKACVDSTLALQPICATCEGGLCSSKNR